MRRHVTRSQVPKPSARTIEMSEEHQSGSEDETANIAKSERDTNKQESNQPVKEPEPSKKKTTVTTSRRSSISINLPQVSHRNSTSMSQSRRPSMAEVTVAAGTGGGSQRLSSLKIGTGSTVKIRKVARRRGSANVLPPIFLNGRRPSVGASSIVEEKSVEAGEGEKPGKAITISIPSATTVRRRRRSSTVRPGSIGTPQVKISASQMEMKLNEKEGQTPKREKRKGPKLEAAEIKRKKEIALTPQELKAGRKYYLDKSHNRLRKVELNKVDSLAPELEGGDDQIVIKNAHQLRGLTHKDDYKLLEKFVIDDKEMSLHDLCKPFIPIGRVSRDYERAIAGDKSRKEKALKRKEKRLKARKLRIPVSKLEGDEEAKRAKERREKVRKMLDKEVDESGTQRMVPKLVTNEDGTVTYSHESTYVDRHSGTTETLDKERIIENPYENLVNSSTYSKRRYVDKWSPQETAEFYRALSTWGTDFGLIAKLFPYRTRRQVKSKFNLEEKKHPHLVEFALVRKLPVDITEYAGRACKKFKSLQEYNNELKELRNKHDKQLEKLAAAKEQARVEDLHQAEQQEITANVTARSRKAVLMEFRKNEEVVGTIDKKK